MTREEAHKQVYEWIDDKIEPEKNKQYTNGKNYTCGTWHYGRMELHRDIDKIYDDFEEELKKAYIDGSNSTNELIQSLYKQIEQLKDKQ